MDRILTHHIDGNGPAVVLLNGGLMSIAAWEPLLPLFGGRFRILRCDFRGQLLSPGEPHPTLVEHAEDLATLFDHLGIERAHLVGPSFGGEVGMIFASRFPDLTASLTVATATECLTEEMRKQSKALCDAALAAASGGDRPHVFRILAPNTFSSAWLATQAPGFLEQRAAWIGMLPPQFFGGLAGLMRALDTLDLGSELPRIKAPTLVIGAELDQVFPVEHCKAIAAAIPGARFELIKGAGHAAVIETPEEFVRLIVEFVDGTKSERRAE
jgi:3-oxoadipate enol-lactonase